MTAVSEPLLMMTNNSRRIICLDLSDERNSAAHDSNIRECSDLPREVHRPLLIQKTNHADGDNDVDRDSRCPNR